MTGQYSVSSKFVCKCLFNSWCSIFSSVMARQVFRYSIVKVQNHQPLRPKGKAWDQKRSAWGFPADGWSGEMSMGAWQPLWVGRQANPS